LVGKFVATSGEKKWPPVGKFVAASGENSMAIDNFVGSLTAGAIGSATTGSSRPPPTRRGGSPHQYRLNDGAGLGGDARYKEHSRIHSEPQILHVRNIRPGTCHLPDSRHKPRDRVVFARSGI
jgi:hypothetical protein